MSSKTLNPSRLEAFSDGVIAVIITIMVLELKVPEAAGWSGLRAVLPTLFLYLLSFLEVGIYWVNHHYMIDEVESVSHRILWANLIFLFCLSLIPFATAWVGTKHFSPFATALYACTCILPGVSYTVLWFAVRSQSTEPAHATFGKHIVSTALDLLAVGAAFYHPMVAMGLLGVVALLWLLPPRQGELGAATTAEKR